ncbi:uncharacterized protein LAESUDRAFT_741531 [Laetiporus sulphureus 93-53]|uniref:Uncharacterized protein n=1 Tax=Laetiporus sulphureus 93-53 TaxID=1314785 RepID=A0A165G4W5_9APHY|nr:uncharacterized protein LAESUDRAFT_741531 [Laetiporus sulphureus 93-53]KZT09833.1 hypothetical protein LAESUDRAFT_741531 [Laetiporus sulphureus 93-53]
MYRPLSPIFDVPEFPTFRRVKPLPKRRRTSGTSSLHDAAGNPLPIVPTMLDAGADELTVHTNAMTAQMALQSYYMPALGAMQDFFKSGLASAMSAPIDLGGGSFGAGDFRGAHDEEAGEGEYVDHLQQPGNTKKRKVPTNMSGSAHGHDISSGTAGAEDEPVGRGIPANGRAGREHDPANARTSLASTGWTVQKKDKLPRATRAGLKHKEMLKSRKRQLAAVLGALSQGDTLALDQALSASYPFARTGMSGDPKDAPPLRVRLSRRRSARLARAFKAFKASLPPTLQESRSLVVPSTEFTFECRSATSDRLIATREEVAVLHARFEQELERQATKAAEAAKQAENALNGPSAKRTDRSKQKGNNTVRGSEHKVETAAHPSQATKDRGGKKKKRSALANASNPHHLKNYVPSRLPNSGHANSAQAVQNAQNLLSPLPIRFLSADIPPRRRKKSDRAVIPVSTLANPADEWICPFCEYGLFYGDEAEYRSAVRNRKKILLRRRRARERAAAAASGAASVKPSEKDVPASDDAHTGYEASVGNSGALAAGKQAKMKEERDRGGAEITQVALG